MSEWVKSSSHAQSKYLTRNKNQTSDNYSRSKWEIISHVYLGLELYLKCLLGGGWYFSPLPEMQHSMVQFCLPRVPFQRSQIKLWQPVCSAVKLFGVSKEGQFPYCWKKWKQEKVHSGTNKVDAAARGRLAVCFLDGNASKMLTQPLLKFQCYVFTYLHMLNRRGIPRVECHGVSFSPEKHTQNIKTDALGLAPRETSTLPTCWKD